SGVVPLDRDLARAEGGVLDLGVGFDPVDTLAHLAPEPGRILERALVHGLVLIVVDPGSARPFRGHAIDLLGHLRLLLPAAAYDCALGVYYRHARGLINGSLVAFLTLVAPTCRAEVRSPACPKRAQACAASG